MQRVAVLIPLLLIAFVSAARTGAQTASDTTGRAAEAADGSADTIGTIAPPASTPVSIDSVRARARRTPAAKVTKIDREIGEVMHAVDRETSAAGEQAVSLRLSAEFNVSADSLLAQRAGFRVGWGELVVGHTLLASTRSGLGIGDIFRLRSDGIGWAQIASGLGLSLGRVAGAVRAEGRVASGQAKADGKIAPIEKAAPK